jgi:hypothetical protein
MSSAAKITLHLGSIKKIRAFEQTCRQINLNTGCSGKTGLK